MHYLLFGSKNNLSNKKDHSISTPANQLSTDQIRNRFNQILTNDTFQKILPYLHCSREELFKKILPQLQILSTKIKSSHIDLLDLTFIINDSSLTEFILELEKSSLNRDTLDKAVLCDNTHALTILEKKGLAVDVRLMRFAVEYDCLECLKYCVTKGFLPNYDALNDAALNGHIHVIKYLVLDRNITPDNFTLDWAIIGSYSTPDKKGEAVDFLRNIVSPKADNQNSRVMNKG